MTTPITICADCGWPIDDCTCDYEASKCCPSEEVAAANLCGCRGSAGRSS